MRSFIFTLILGLSAVFPVKADYGVFLPVFAKIHEENPQHLSYERITEEALKGLQNMDGRLKFGMKAGRVTVYYGGKMTKSLRKPEQDTAESWAALAEEVLEDVKKISEKISLHDFEAADEMLAAVTLALNDGSKYYKAMDMAGDSAFIPHRAFSAYRKGNLLHIKIKVFDKDSPSLLRQAMANEKNADAMVLDLRGNSGGSLAAMSEIADMFLDDGIIASVNSVADNEEKFYNARSGGEWTQKPLVVLVDADTASSAEVLALSLQEQGRAELVGTRTYGKGTVQTLSDLENGSRLSLTTAALFGPSGAPVAKSGLIPDICTAFMGEGQKPEFVANQQKAADCPRQQRENEPFDFLVAKALIYKKL